MLKNKRVHPDLLLAQQCVYHPSRLVVRNLKVEDESADYGAAEFIIDNQRIKFRAGKITPTKVGQFVTFWKRIGNGPILPYNSDDPFDLLVISVRAENHFGQFIFPKMVLSKKGIVTTDQKEGKRAMRIYPPWDITDSDQAQKTQNWQLEYFVDASEQLPIDFARVQHLFK